jgi:hypothetical protein
VLSPQCAFIIKSAFGTPKSFVWPQCDSKKLRFQKTTECGAIVLRQKWSRGQVETRFAGMQPCLNHQTIISTDRWSVTVGWSAWAVGWAAQTGSDGEMV